jgi:hypothetical protein
MERSPVGRERDPRASAGAFVPGLVALHDRGHAAFDDRRLHRAERGEHPGDRAGPGIRIVRQQARMALREVEDDRPRLEQDEIAVLIGRDLSERMKRAMLGFLHRAERQQPNVVGLAHLFERPANAHVAGQSPAAIGRPFEGGDGDGHAGLQMNDCTTSRAESPSGSGSATGRPGRHAFDV